jgi:hypothetical protein
MFFRLGGVTGTTNRSTWQQVKAEWMPLMAQWRVSIGITQWADLE